MTFRPMGRMWFFMIGIAANFISNLGQLAYHTNPNIFGIGVFAGSMSVCGCIMATIAYCRALDLNLRTKLKCVTIPIYTSGALGGILVFMPPITPMWALWGFIGWLLPAMIVNLYLLFVPGQLWFNKHAVAATV